MKSKILFIDISLHKNDATGITLSNLFSSWPKENLYMISEPGRIKLSKEQGYLNLYTLGINEITHKFPINFLKRIKNNITQQPAENIPIVNSELSNGDRNAKPSFLKGLFHKFGLQYYFFRLSISTTLEKWINDANPDYLYCVLSTRHSIEFALNLSKKFKKPLMIHILDDWPMTIGTDTYFSTSWNAVINRELKELLGLAYRKIAISEKMANEYSTRFGGTWFYFHNPVDASKWEPFRKKEFNFQLTSRPIKIAYFGRFGKANDEAIKTFSKAIELFDDKNYKVEFHLYTQVSDFVRQELTSKHVFIHSFIQNDLVPAEISKYDFLFLPLSLNEADVKFARLSIPTKFSEYLISGVPTILMAPKNCAVREFSEKYDCTFILETFTETEICGSLEILFADSLLQQKISDNAIRIANEKFESLNVCKAFIEMFN